MYLCPHIENMTYTAERDNTRQHTLQWHLWTLKRKLDITFSTTLLFFTEINVYYLCCCCWSFVHADILIIIVTVFINVICKAYPTANEKHWIDGNYDDIS